MSAPAPAPAALEEGLQLETPSAAQVATSARSPNPWPFVALLLALALVPAEIGAVVAIPVVLGLLFLRRSRFRAQALVVACALPFLQYAPLPFAQGVSLTDVLVAVIVVVGLLSARRSRHEGARAIPLAVMVYYALSWASVPTSVSVVTSARFMLALTAAWGLFTWASRLRTLQEGEQVLAALMAILAVNAVVAVIQRLTGEAWLVESFLSEYLQQERTIIDEGTGKSTGLTIHGNSLALLCTMLLPLAVAFLRVRGRPLTALALVGLGLAACLVSLSRGGLLAICAEVLVLLYVRWRGARLLFAVSAIGVVAVGFLLAAGVIPIEAVLPERMSNATYVERDAGANAARLASAKAGVNAFLARPLNGIGIGTSDRAFVDFGGWTGLGPHNLYLYLLSERGVLCFLAFAALTLLAFRTASRLYRTHRDMVALACMLSLTGVLVHGMFESILTGVFQYLLLLVLGLLVSRARVNARLEAAHAA